MEIKQYKYENRGAVSVTAADAQYDISFYPFYHYFNTFRLALALT